jgi:DNA topoisomerase-1
MQAAQKLYEGIDIGGETVGLITYMRTDGVSVEPEGIAEARSVIGNVYGAPYVPETPRYYKAKAKNAQEAHEAIRPTSLGRNPGSLRLEPDLGRLYELIWKRMIASQMESARIERTTVDLESADGQTGMRATGQVVLFPGYLAVYEEGRDDEGDEDSARLPMIEEGAAAKVLDARADQHFTEPPPRYSEASLVKKMEELGIGRPSTYASVLTVLRDREYVRMDKQRFIPEDKGRLVTAFLEQFFRRYVEYDFTAALEEQLDLVSDGKLDWKQFLRDFWKDFHAAVGEIAELRTTNVLDALNESLGPHIFPDKGDGSNPRLCPTCGTGHAVAEGRQVRGLHRLLELSRMPLHPPAGHQRGRRRGRGRRQGAGDQPGDRSRGVAEERPLRPLCRGTGPGRERRQAQALQPAQGLDAGGLDLEKALRLLSLPREVGAHPDDGKTITAGLGRFGPFVLHDGTYANLENPKTSSTSA